MGTCGRRLQVLLLVVCAVSSNAQQHHHHASSSPSDPQQPSPPPVATPQLVQLKHHRYKSLRNNLTLEKTSSSPTTHHLNIIAEDDYDAVDPHHPLYHKQPRSGLQLQKSPPDLQFGLAFTVPFVSLSTEKLLNSVSGKNFDSVSSLLKLNFSGLLLAAVVGLVAVAGLFLPSILGPGGLGGWGAPWLDNFGAQFTGEQYNDYENGWNKPGFGSSSTGWKNEFLGRNGRALGQSVLGILNRVRSNVEGCVVERVCEQVRSNTRGSLLDLVDEISGNELVKDVAVVRTLKSVVGGDYSGCGKVKNCGDSVERAEELLADMFKTWGAAAGAATDKAKKE